MAIVVMSAIGALVIGALLFFRGAFPKRVGDTPFCRKCRYNLTGLDADRCPECGQQTDNPLIGERVRKKGLMRIGGALCLLALLGGGALGVAKAYDFNWYQRAPLWWVLRDIRESGAAGARRAAAELSRRHAAGALDEKQRVEVAKVCLAEQGRDALRPNVSWTLIDILGDLYDDDILTDAQKQEFAENVTKGLTPVTHKRVPIDVPFKVALDGECRVPSQWESWNSGGVERVVVRLPKSLWGDFDHEATRYAPLCSTMSLSEPGRQRIETEMSVEVRPPDWSEGEDPDATAKRVFSANVQAEAASAEMVASLLRSPDLDAHIQENLSIGPVWIEPLSSGAPSDVDTTAALTSGEETKLDDAALQAVQAMLAQAPSQRQSCLEFEIDLRQSAPVSLAFDIICELAGERQQLGSVASEANQTHWSWRSTYYGHWPDDLAGEPVTIILRASPRVAFEDLTTSEIWGGEIRFENVKITPGQWTQSAPPGEPMHGVVTPEEASAETSE